MASYFFPSASTMASAFTLPHVTGSLMAPGAVKAPVFTVAGVLDDAKDKAKQLESQAKDQVNKAVDSANVQAGEIQKKVQNATGTGGAGGKIELYSPKYYATCAFGGIAACGTTHTLVTPLDLVKCRRQVDKNIYKGNLDGWSKIWATEGGLGGIYTGWGPTFLGYSMQGACKYGFYEFFKKTYSDLAGPENAKKYKDAIYLAGSASAEFIADVALCPMEAVKVRIQTTIPPYANGLVDGTSKFLAQEGYGGFFKALPSLWARQIPYTMMKFWSFEATVTQIYKYLGKPASAYNKGQQLLVSFAGGYIAGVFCAVVSHPADVMVSKLNAKSADGQVKTIGSIYKEIGFGGLWNGLGTRIVMIGTLTALQWAIYDSIKVYFGIPTTGSAPAPEKK